LPRRTAATDAQPGTGAEDALTVREALPTPLREALVRSLTQEASSLGALWLLAGQLAVGIGGSWDDVPEHAVLEGHLERCAQHASGTTSLEAQRVLASLELPLEKVLELLTGLVANRLALPHPARFAEVVNRVGPLPEWTARFLEHRQTLED